MECRQEEVFTGLAYSSNGTPGITRAQIYKYVGFSLFLSTAVI